MRREDSANSDSPGTGSHVAKPGTPIGTDKVVNKQLEYNILGALPSTPPGHIPRPVLPEYTDSMGTQWSEEGPHEPTQYENEGDLHTEHQLHAEVFLQETVGEIPPALAHRNLFGPPHTGEEALHIDGEMDLARATAK